MRMRSMPEAYRGRRPAEASAELRDQARVRNEEIRWIKPTAPGSKFAKPPDGGRGQVADFHTWHWNAIPSAPLLAQQEAVERGSFEFLECAAAAQVVVASVADRIWEGIDHDLQKGFPTGTMQIYCHHDAQQIADLVG